MTSAADQPAKGHGHRTALDVSAQRVARVYAEALLDAAEAKAQVEPVLAELGSLFDDLFRDSPELAAFFLTAGISRRAKKAVLEQSFTGRVSDVFLNFLLVLDDHDRLYLLPYIRPIVHELADERAGRMAVQVSSAVPLPEDQRERLRQQLRDTFRKEPVIEEKVDPDLLGGLVVRVGDWLYDASVRTRLENLRKQLIERRSHVTNPVG
jgi:F-type H+-transporting ATPase subunit delta